MMKNNYEYFLPPLKTYLYYRVKYKSFKMLQLLYKALLTKLSTPPF